MSDNPCRGHECDLCHSCKKGRCCRRDNPHYALPEEGSWQPFYGVLGVRNIFGDQMECHACGAWFRSVGSHSWVAHDLTAREYKATFGLTNRGLVGPSVRAERSAHGKRLVAEGRVELNPTAVTPEQHKYARRSREQRAATMAHVATFLVAGQRPEVREKAISRAREAMHAKARVYLCEVCGGEFRWSTYRSVRKTCSRECASTLLSRSQTVAWADPSPAQLGHLKRLHQTEWTPEMREAARQRGIEANAKEDRQKYLRAWEQRIGPEALLANRRKAGAARGALSVAPHPCPVCGKIIPRSTPRTCSPECRLEVRRRTGALVMARRHPRGHL